MSNFGEYLKNLRFKAGLSIRDVEGLSGVSNPYISMIESGRRPAPHPNILKKLAKCYGVKIETIMSYAGYLSNHSLSDNYEVTSGKYKGSLITRVPPSHLKHMININHPDAAQARKELHRRGTIIPDIDVSGHAIDRASLRCMDIYNKSKKKDEGFYAWLIRMSQSALKNGTKDGEKILYKGMKFFFSTDTRWPVLKSVMVSRKYEKRQRNRKNGFVEK